MLDISNISELSQFGYDKDLTVSLTKDENGKNVTNQVILDSINCPRKPISFSQYLIFFNGFRRCLVARGINKCRREERILNQYIKIDNLTTRGLISLCTNNDSDELKETAIETAAVSVESKDNNSINNIEEVNLENGQAALGTLLLPYLYIRWGENIASQQFSFFYVR